ncbi:MAG: amino acid racemase [Lachnospiraceae bacterium]|nr:amino acid racemase [Lachnospiraceae bacterium]
MFNDVIGLIGGFGGYATLDFYRRILETFRGDTEREFPHIIIDNDFTMPSRTRCLLTGEGYKEIVNGIKKSMSLLIKGGASYIVLVCGTAHFFLEDVYKDIPEAKKRVLDIIDITGEYYSVEQDSPLFVMAAEGTLKQELYVKKLGRQGIKCVQPGADDYPEIRYLLECVKQNSITDETCERFIKLIDKYCAQNVLLGCTELPVIVNSHQMNGWSKSGKDLERYSFYDPLEYTLKRLVEILQ